MERIRVNVKCPCGALLYSTTVDYNSKRGGTTSCSVCKKRCRWQIANGEGFAAYER